MYRATEPTLIDYAGQYWQRMTYGDAMSVALWGLVGAAFVAGVGLAKLGGRR